MTRAELIQKIRREIERNRQAIRVLNEYTAPEQMSKTCAIFQYSDSILSELLSFLSALEEQVCPEYCVRSHCIGCSRNDYDIWSNKPIKAKVKATGEVVEGFTDGQGNFYVFVDHDIMNRYDVNELEFDTLESEKPMNQEGLEEEIEREWNDCDGKHSDTDYQIVELTKDDFSSLARHFAQWQKEQMMKDGNVILAEEDFDAEKEKSIEWGYNLCKDQMLKEAVEGKIGDLGFHNAVYLQEQKWTNILDGFKKGDKVRIIIVKEDEK